MAIVVTGEWRKRGGTKMKQMQSNIGQLKDSLEAVADKIGGRRGDAARWILRAVLDSEPPLEIREVGIEGPENLTCISVPEDMYQSIEAARGDIPRSSFVRAMLAAGLRMIEERGGAI